MPMGQIPGSGIAASAPNFHRYCQIISINIAPFYIPRKIYKSAYFPYPPQHNVFENILISANLKNGSSYHFLSMLGMVSTFHVYFPSVGFVNAHYQHSIHVCHQI